LQLDLILRGQSNAAYLMELDRFAAAGLLVTEVERLLGFDGVSDRVTLVYDRDGQGGDTVYPATAYLGDWMTDTGQGWVAGPLGTAYLQRIDQYRAGGMGDATATIWMHSEYDSRDPGLSTAGWMQAVRNEAAWVETTLGRDVPYLFVAAHPYGDGTDAGHQALRAGMEALAADPWFDGRIAARAPDIDASLDDLDGNSRTVEYGFAHISPEDARLIAGRIAQTVAEEWAEHARPGSPVALAGGNIPTDGPRVIAATMGGSDWLRADVYHDAAPGLAPLSQGAAAGLGWSARLPDGRRIEAVEALIEDWDSIVMRFASPLSAGAVLDYAYGIGRVAEPFGPGQGNAVTDVAGLPAWTPAEGVGIWGAW